MQYCITVLLACNRLHVLAKIDLHSKLIVVLVRLVCATEPENTCQKTKKTIFQ